MSNNKVPKLGLVEKFFLRYCCVPPPPEPFEPRDSYDTTKPQSIERDPLRLARDTFGREFEEALKGKVFLDVGCGPGNQVMGAAQAGARLAVGVDKTEVSLRIAETNAASLGLTERVRFTTDTVQSFGEGWADIAYSQNSFEHFDNPEQVLSQVHAALKPGGKFYITFSPPWWHPFGVHHMFMIKIPWAHLFFSEKTILRVRQLYRPNKPVCWREVSLNQMTIKKALGLVRDSPFNLSKILLLPIGPLPNWVVNMRIFREWTSSRVSLILTKIE